MLARSLPLLLAISIACFDGCSGKEDASQAPTANAPTATAPAPAPAASDPAMIAAHGFLSALIKGDTQAATQLLTPQAIQQFATSGQRFTALGPETMQFRLGEMRKVSDSQTLVQCMLSDKPAEGEPTQEQEMCCVVKLVDGQWRVSGIVVDSPSGAAPLVLDFERPEQPAPAPPPPSQNFVEQPAGSPPAAVRTAQEPALPPQR